MDSDVTQWEQQNLLHTRKRENLLCLEKHLLPLSKILNPQNSIEKLLGRVPRSWDGNLQPVGPNLAF